jgi:hypothetical protein
MIQSPIYHTSGQGRTGTTLSGGLIAAEAQLASPELEARIGLILAGFLDPVHPPKRRHHQRKLPTPDGLLTRAQAAAKLNCSLRTLDGHVASGALRYVVIGHGKKRPRRMFTAADLDEFIANQTRKDVPCPSIASGARRSGSSISGFEVIAFTGLRNARPGGKPKK